MSVAGTFLPSGVIAKEKTEFDEGHETVAEPPAPFWTSEVIGGYSSTASTPDRRFSFENYRETHTAEPNYGQPEMRQLSIGGIYTTSTTTTFG